MATPNPVYVQGDYNSGATTNYSSTSGGTSTASALTASNQPASNGSGAYPNANSAPDETSGSHLHVGGGGHRRRCGDDPVPTVGAMATPPPRSIRATPTSTTINSAIVAGNVPTTSSAYSGGIENFPRLLEDWSSSLYLTIHGSFGLLYDSEQATGVWQNTGNYYNAPSRRWFFDPTLQDKNPPGFPVAYAYGMGAWTLK